jgi:hypothetical protein
VRGTPEKIAACKALHAGRFLKARLGSPWYFALVLGPFLVLSPSVVPGAWSVESAGPRTKEYERTKDLGRTKA